MLLLGHHVAQIFGAISFIVACVFSVAAEGIKAATRGGNRAILWPCGRWYLSLGDEKESAADTFPKYVRICFRKT